MMPSGYHGGMWYESNDEWPARAVRECVRAGDGLAVSQGSYPELYGPYLYVSFGPYSGTPGFPSHASGLRRVPVPEWLFLAFGAGDMPPGVACDWLLENSTAGRPWLYEALAGAGKGV
jgi:hypothetical protein